VGLFASRPVVLAADVGQVLGSLIGRTVATRSAGAFSGAELEGSKGQDRS